MNNFLDTILARKREEINARSKAVPVERLKQWPAFSRRVRSLRGALEGKRPGIIAEIKKASPSKGILKTRFNHRTIARQYVEGGANALSVLTEKSYFQGDLFYLEDLSSLISIPILQKDFIIDSYQLHESKAHGADAILLIVAAMSRTQLADLHAEAEHLGLECLVEVHTERDVTALEGVNAKMVGINNRDLATFETDLTTTAKLRPLLPSKTLVVSESGINAPEHVTMMAGHDVHTLLIGEHFMTSPNPGATLREFLDKARRV